MSDLTELRALMQPGVTVQVTNHVYPELSGPRTVLRAQTAQWELTLPPTHQRYSPTHGSWLEIPKARDLERDSEGNFVIARPGEWGDTGPFCTIAPIKEG